MKKMKTAALGTLLLMLVLALALTGCNTEPGYYDVPAEDDYTFVNPEKTKAEADANIVIDGVLDEEAYANNNWLYLYNDEGGNDVNIAMTSHYGEKGMYFVFDVTESVPIYVNLNRDTFMNSCIELYLAPSYVESMQDNGVFEIDLLPTGDILFKRGNGKISGNNTGFSNVASSNDIMAYLGTTTKGGEVNSQGCYGYCLELFIPWDYMQWLGVDVDALKDGFVYINPAHITSYNQTGTDAKIDRYWYHYAQQNGAKFTNVKRYFCFNGEGVMGGLPVTLQPGEHYTISGATNIIPGMDAFVTIKPDAGYALTSIMVNGEEQIGNVSFNQDGSVTLKLKGTDKSVEISAKTEAISEGTKTITGKVVLSGIKKDTWEGLVLTYTGPNGELPLQIDAEGNFELKGLEQGFYILKAEKNGYMSVSRSVYLNRDTHVELVLGYEYFQVTQGNWDLSNQHNGSIIIVNKQKDGTTVMTNASTYTEVSVTVKDFTPSKNADGSLKQGDFAMQIAFVFSDGKQYEVRIHNTDADGNYKIQTVGGDNHLTGWKWRADLTEEQKKSLLEGDGVKFTVKLEGSDAVMYIDGTKMATVALGDDYNGKTAQVKLCMNGNKNGQNIEVPFELK